MDNASIHKEKAVHTFAKNSGLRMVTIPHYEPCLNPVEKMILAIKMKIRKQRQLGKYVWWVFIRVL